MRSTVQTLVVVGLLSSLGGCAVFLPAHPRSNLRKKEKTRLFLVENTTAAPGKPLKLTSSGTANGDAPESALTGAALGAKAIELAVDQSQKALEKEASLYTASFASKGVGEFFLSYDKNPDTRRDSKNKTENVMTIDAAVKLSAFVLAKTAEDEIQSIYKFRVEPQSKGDAFQLFLDDVWIRGSKAKVFEPSLLTKFPLLYGWFLDSDESVDLQPVVRIEAVWTDQKQKQHREIILELGDGSMPPLKDVAISGDDSGPSATDVGCAAWTWLIDKDATLPTRKDFNHLRPRRALGLFSSVPVSIFPDGTIWGRGNYTLTVQVTESDDFGQYPKKAAEAIEEDREKIIQKANEFLTTD